MIKKILKYFRIIPIDVLVYAMNKETIAAALKLDFTIETESVTENKKRFFITVDGNVVHESFLFRKLFLLHIIHKKGPTIGDCRTIESFKGKSIYPFVINQIAREEILKNNQNEVFIIVNPDNISSIKGIEKAGFKLFAKITAKRFLVFHYAVHLNKS